MRAVMGVANPRVALLNIGEEPSKGTRDTIEAHELLGQGVAALQDANFLTLQGNLEPLKLTFDEATADLLSKIMQGTDERYRLSVAFQIRPVAIMTSAEPHASLLVGIDYTTSPETIIGKDAVGIDVLPSLGPRLSSVEVAPLAAISSSGVVASDGKVA